MSAGRVFPPGRFAHLDPPLSRLDRPLRVEGRSFELRRVARVYVWGRWFVLSIATFAWLYPLNVDEVVYAPNVALAILLFATNGYLHYRLATERSVSWRWMLALSALDLAMLSAGVAAHRGYESPFFVGYYPSPALFAVVFGSVGLTLVWVTMAAAVYAALCLTVESGLDFSALLAMCLP